MKKKENPKHYEVAKNTAEKNLEWVLRCTGKYLKEFKEAKEKGPVNIDGMGAIFPTKC